MKWNTWLKSSPNITPAAPARTEPMKNVDAITRSVSIPIIAAASRSYEVARIAFPICVLATSTVRATISPTVVERTITWISWTFTLLTTNSASVSGPGSKNSGFSEPRTNES